MATINVKKQILNFCASYLQPSVQCSTISTDGYEVTNLVEDSDKGFLAYPCIKPPVDIDFTFLCHISIHYILIWPSIGSQKSSGFQIYAKLTEDKFERYSLISTGHLNSNENGILFYSTNLDHTKISVPSNFAKCYLKASLRSVIKDTKCLRVHIFKTEKSVPAIAKIEVWGTVSSKYGGDVVAYVNSLCPSIQAPSQLHLLKGHTTTNKVQEIEETPFLKIPEQFLDAITYEIMTLPVILPSGKIIDQTTLQKYEQSEAVWGRTLSDPFTGLLFNESRKPIIATNLKASIDKFLLDNSNADEIKRLPRVLGSKRTLMTNEIKLLDVKSLTKKRCYETQEGNFKKPRNENQGTMTVTSSGKTVLELGKSKSLLVYHNKNKREENCTKIQDNNGNDSDDDIKLVLSSLKRFTAVEKHECVKQTTCTCDCCSNGVFYRLPCKHAVCRKMLIKDEIKQCQICNVPYKTSQLERIYS